MSVQLVQTGVRFPDGTTQITAASSGVTSVNGMTGAVTITSGIAWKVTYNNYAVSNGSAYPVPANCIGFYVWVSIFGGNNTGCRVYCTLRNKSNQDYFTIYVAGTNENGGPDGGSGMTDSHAAFIPLDPATIGYVYFYYSGGNGFSGYIQSFVTSQ